MNDKITVIYHSADFDGIFCREIARKFLPTAELIGWDYGNDKLAFPTEGTVYVLDLSPECFEELPVGYTDRLVWIDHHKSAIEKFHPEIWGYRIDGVAACRLAWQWFSGFHAHAGKPHLFLTKESFINRDVSEPLAVQLAGEYDIWDKRNPDVDVFQLGLRSRELGAEDWKYLLLPESEALSAYDAGQVKFRVECLLDNGRLLQGYVNGRDAEITKALAFVVEFEGLKFLALNSATKGSLQFAAKDVPETGHDALLKFNYTGSVWDVSLYHAKHRTDLDLSLIAGQHGGGGHRGACGFRAKSLPFLRIPQGNAGTFQERVIAEKQELDDKRTKLTAFIGGNGAYRTLPEMEQSRLNRQLEAMTLYSNVLEERIASF